MVGWPSLVQALLLLQEKQLTLALTSVAQFVAYHTTEQKVTVSIPIRAHA